MEFHMEFHMEFDMQFSVESQESCYRATVNDAKAGASRNRTRAGAIAGRAPWPLGDGR